MRLKLAAAEHLENIGTETLSGAMGAAGPAPPQEFFPDPSPRQQGQSLGFTDPLHMPLTSPRLILIAMIRS